MIRSMAKTDALRLEYLVLIMSKIITLMTSVAVAVSGPSTSVLSFGTCTRGAVRRTSYDQS